MTGLQAPVSFNELFGGPLAGMSCANDAFVLVRNSTSPQFRGAAAERILDRY
jgi:hypothetical protein